MRKKILAIIVTLAVVMTMIPTVAFADGDAAYEWYGDGTATEYTLTSAADLKGFANIVNGTDGKTAYDFAGKTVKLGADIDLAGINWIPIGNWDASGNFKGEFDGKGFTVLNLNINFENRNNAKTRAGLFASPVESYIHDLTLNGVTINGSGSNVRAGALAGNIWTGTEVENVNIKNVTASINGDGDNLIGGAAGYVYFGRMINIAVENVKISNNSANGVYVGGFTAYAAGHTNAGGAYNWIDVNGDRVKNSLFENCSIKGVDIEVKAEQGAIVGGFVAGNNYNNSENFYADCTVEDLNMICDGNNFVAGGFIAKSYGQSTTNGYSFDDCSVKGSITGTTGIYGGFVGSMLGRAKAYAGASADVNIICSGTAGGFIGKTAHTHQNNKENSQKVSFTNCIAGGDVTADIAGGFIGEITIGNDESKRIEFMATDCTATGKVSGTMVTGGFAGKIDGSRVCVSDSYVNIELCEGSSEITSSGEKGGIVGFIKDNKDFPTLVTITGYSGYEGGIISNNSDVDNAKALVLDTKNVDFEVGDAYTIKAYTIPASEVIWSSTDSNIVTVDKNGNVTAAAVGEAGITATTGNIVATCTCVVTEEEKVPAGTDDADKPVEGDVADKADEVDSVETGDNMNMALPIGIAGLALVAMVAVVTTRRRRN